MLPLTDKSSLLITLVGFGLAVFIAHPAFALLLAATINLVFAPKLPKMTKQGGRYLLQGAIVFLGLTMNVEALWSVSQDYSVLIVGYILSTLCVGLILGRFLRVDTDQARLLVSGTAICGGTAIATLGPVIRARSESVAVCLAIVFLLNAIAILVLPKVGIYLEISQTQFGVWVALAIHDTSSVVGAAAIYGDEALQVATTVKLVRTLWLIPLVLAAGILMNRRETKTRLPGFVLLFVLFSIIGSVSNISGEWIAGIKTLSQTMLVAALFFMGLEITRDALRRLNGRAVS
ncbi:MAG TPA: putative sulfate exporter family transporter, partial [Gammaproteobacteria bacterium]|nr:putative sulfate exporter family transporter [Gammaproteobacteria bacterium]